MLFSAVNLGRFLNVTPEIALAKACDKFIARFGEVEAEAEAEGIKLDEQNIQKLDELWDKAKQK